MFFSLALTILRDNRDVMDKLAAFLLEKETITGEEFMEILKQCDAERQPVSLVKENQ